MDEPRQMEALDAYLDRLAWGDEANPDELDPALAAVARRVRRLGAASTPAVAPDRVWRRIDAPGRGEEPRMTVSRLAFMSLQPLARPARSRRWALPRLSLAALLLVAFVAAGIALRPNDHGSGHAPGFLLAPAATPSPAAAEVSGVYDRVIPKLIWFSITRDHLQPGATISATNAGPDLLLVESGEVVVNVAGPGATVTRAGSANATALAAGVDVALGPGDGASIPSRVGHQFRNDLQAPAVVIEAFINDVNGPLPPHGVISISLVESYFEGLPAPATIALRRLTLGVGESLPAAPAGTVLAFPVAGSSVNLVLEGGRYRNATARPLDIYVLTLTSAAGATPFATPSA
jgi:hypothetical protein